MPKISIEKTSSLSAPEAFAKIKAFLSDDRDLRKMDSNYQCQFDDKNLTGTAKGKQFEANLKVVSGGRTQVSLVITIPLLLTPFKGMVETTLNKKLDSALG